MPEKQNLNHKLTVEEQRAGGKASAKARKDKANLRKCLEMLLEFESPDENGTVMSGAEKISTRLYQQALKGDVRAFEVLRDTAGQKPADKVITSNVDPDIINEVERMVHGTDEN